MPKEMIISVNGREKKIAIIEDGNVSEFYIERDEDNSGIVGNIYKGRVQRVLPGMQSAFVSVGLEKDAFLYVSDFFDEEEEIERIVIEKSKEIESPDDVDRAATDEIQKTRLRRDKKIDDVHEKAEINVDPNDDDDKDSKDLKKPARKASAARRGRPRKKVEEKINEKAAKKGRDKPVTPVGKTHDDKAGKPKSKRGRPKTDKPEKKEKKKNILDTSDLDIGKSSFERIVDNDDDTGEMLKDAIMQEAISDRVRLVEFDIESSETVEIGSLIDSVSEEIPSLQRIADDDEDVLPSTSSPTKKTATKKRKSHVQEDSSDSETPVKNPSNSILMSLASAARKTLRGDEDKTNDKDLLDDAEAKISESPKVDEMTVRRGSRGGRRRTEKPLRRKSEPESRETHLDKSYSVTDESEPVTAESEIADAEFKKKPKTSGRRTGRGRGGRNQPKITDLLKQGQEILVQIAKEPIARKGARITSHIALPGRFLVYMPTIEHLGVSRKISSSTERARLRKILQKIAEDAKLASGGFIVRTAGTDKTESELRDDGLYLVKTWQEIKLNAESANSPELIHQDLDLILRLLRDNLSEEFTAIRVDSEVEYQRIIEFVNRIQPSLVKRVKFHTHSEPILDTYGVSDEIDKALKHRVWLRSGGYLVINQTEALIAIDVNTGKFVGKGNARLEDTITKTNIEAASEIARQIRLRDLGGIIVLDLIDMEDRRNRDKVLRTLQESLAKDKSPTKVLSFNDFGLVIMTRKRVKQSLERTLCSPCEHCEGAGWVKSAQTICYEILDEARRLSRELRDVRHTTLRTHSSVAKALTSTQRDVFEEIENYLGVVDLTGDSRVHNEQFDFAFV